MKNKDKRPRCRACGAYLFNYDSMALGLCSEHRIKLAPQQMEEFRKVVREKMKSPTKTRE